MSLPVFDSQTPLFSLAAVSGQLFADDDRFRLFAEKIYPRLVAVRGELASCYCADNGRPAVEPVLVLGVSLLQFLDNVPDRQALELLGYHAGWAFALNRALGEPGFDPTVLVRFRERLIEHKQAHRAFAAILEGLQEAGLVARQSKQRLDSMFVMGRLARMSTLECVRQTLGAVGIGDQRVRVRQARLVERAAGALRGKPLRLSQRGGDAASQAATSRRRPALVVAMGKGAVRSDDCSRAEDAVARARSGGTLRGRRWRGRCTIRTNRDAQWSAKGQGRQRKEVVGYKTQVAETVPDTVRAKGEPTAAFLTAVETQPATASDEAGHVQVETAQAHMEQEPASAWHVDGAYVSAERIAQMQAQGRELIGPAQPAPKKDGRYSTEDFDVSIAERRAVCPAGKANTQCSRLEEEKTGKVSYRFEWSTQCHDCALREKCLGKDQRHRTLVVGEHHDLLQARRREQKTQAFAEEKNKRNAIEGTQSELVRGHGARQARYRGLPKVRLQNYLIGAACNAKRWIRRLQWEIKQAAKLAKEGAVFVPSG